LRNPAELEQRARGTTGATRWFNCCGSFLPISVVRTREERVGDPFPGHNDLDASDDVVVSERQDYDCVLCSALNVGAVGFIPKSASRETILDAFRLIFAGGHYIPWPPSLLDPCDGPVKPRPLPPRTPGTAQAVDAAVVADSQGRAPWQS
jgi:hypothetical protein